jgi:hypothetical protein
MALSAASPSRARASVVTPASAYHVRRHSVAALGIGSAALFSILAICRRCLIIYLYRGWYYGAVPYTVYVRDTHALELDNHDNILL